MAGKVIKSSAVLLNKFSVSQQEIFPKSATSCHMHKTFCAISPYYSQKVDFIR